MSQADEILRRLSDEVDTLVQSGRWDKAAFNRVHREAVAAGGRGDDLEFLYMEAQESWLEELLAKRSA